MAAWERELSGEEGERVDASRRKMTPLMGWEDLEEGGRGRPDLGSRGRRWDKAVERSLGWPGVSIRRKFRFGWLSEGEETEVEEEEKGAAALSLVETGVWEVCVFAGSVFSSVEVEVERPARFSNKVRRAVLPAPEGPARRIDGREAFLEEEPDSLPWRTWWRKMGKSRTMRTPVMMTVLLGWREAMSKSLMSSLMGTEAEGVLDAAATVAVMVSIIVSMVAVEACATSDTLRGVSIDHLLLVCLSLVEM